jgi:hypothetical protein
MEFFPLFLPALAFLMALTSLAVLYWIIKGCKESAFIPTYYFLGFSILAVVFMSMGRLVKTLYGTELFNFVLLQDLLLAYIALFLFGSLWQSYEAELSVPPDFLDE